MGRKEKYACFACRKMFRQPMRGDMARPIGKEEPRVVACPQCGQTMTNMGKYFETPRQTDVKQWRKVQELCAHGYLFGGSGYPRPATLQEVEPFLAEQKRLRAEWARQSRIRQRATELSQRRNKRARVLQEKRVTKAIQAAA